MNPHHQTDFAISSKNHLGLGPVIRWASVGRKHRHGLFASTASRGTPREASSDMCAWWKAGPGLGLAPAMRAALRRVDAEVPAYDVQTMEDVLEQSTATQRFNTFLLSTLGLTGLILAAIGIYGVIAFFVSQRTHEIGVRIALGATAASVVGIVVRHATTLAALGIAIGGVAAYWATTALSSMLFGVTPRESRRSPRSWKVPEPTETARSWQAYRCALMCSA